MSKTVESSPNVDMDELLGFMAATCYRGNLLVSSAYVFGLAPNLTTDVIEAEFTTASVLMSQVIRDKKLGGVRWMDEAGTLQLGRLIGVGCNIDPEGSFDVTIAVNTNPAASTIDQVVSFQQVVSFEGDHSE